MKVAHFSDGDNYGALGAAYELHKKMLDQGIESRFFLRIKSREDACIEEISDNTVLYRLRQLIHTIYFDRNRTDTTMFFSYNPCKTAFSSIMRSSIALYGRICVIRINKNATQITRNAFTIPAKNPSIILIR